MAIEKGAVVQHFASFADLTRHIQDEVRSEMLIDELNHRVKNTLSSCAKRSEPPPTMRRSGTQLNRGSLPYHGRTTF